MRSINFNFRPDVPPERQDQVLEGIAGWGAVRSASRLNPKATLPALVRMAYAYLAEDASADDVIRQLKELPEIESAEAPSSRRLIR